MNYAVFFLGKDRETGKIVDDCFVTISHGLVWLIRGVEGAEESAKDICRGWGLEYIDSDGPYWVPLWPTLPINRRPKWGNRLPGGIAADVWAERFRSTDELAVFRNSLKAGKIK